MGNQKKKKSGYFGLFGSIVCTVLCLLFLLLIIDISIRDIDIYNNSNQTVGTIHEIVRTGSRSRGGRRRTAVYIRYSVDNTEYIQGLSTVSSRRFASRPIGARVHVRYNPNNHNLVVESSDDIKAFLIVSIIFLGYGIFHGMAGIYHRYMYGKQ